MFEDIGNDSSLESSGDKDDSSVFSSSASDEDDCQDELASDEDDNAPAPRSGKGRGDDPFVLTNTLPASRSISYSTKWLHDQVLSESIDLNPAYQRDVVWSAAKQGSLIDSVLRNFYIPPIIFCVKANEDGTERRRCIDGKQRLASLHGFFSGSIPFINSSTNKKFWYKRAKDKPKRRILPKKYKALFQTKVFLCIEYDELDDKQEREIFQRVQMGVSLTPAERLQAIAGPLPDTIKEACDLVVDVVKSNEDLEIQTARARVFQNVASVAFLIAKAPSQPLPTFTSLEKWLNTASTIKNNVREDTIATFTRFISLLLNPALSKPITRIKLSPAEFIMVCYLISLVRESCSDEEISGAVSELRDIVRAAHTDIRTNNTVFKTMFSFVNDFRNKSIRKTTHGSKRKQELDDVGPNRKRASRPTQSITTSVPGPSQTSSGLPSTTPVSIVRRPATHSTTPRASPPPHKSASAESPTVVTSQEVFDPLALIEEAKRMAQEYQEAAEHRAQQSSKMRGLNNPAIRFPDRQL